MKVTASDGSTTVSDEFDITVSAADNTAPTVTSIERQDPTALLTNSDTPTWRVTFSEAVKNVDGTDFVITGTTATPTATPVTLVPGGYDVTLTGGDIASLTGTITLAFASAQNIADTADNELAATAPTGINEPTFEMDNTVPTFVSGTANGTLIVMTFSEDLDPNSLPPGEAFDVSALGDFSTPQPVVNSVAIEGTLVTLTVTPALFTDHTVTVSNNAYDDGMGRVPLKDAAGNAVQPAVIVGSYSVTNETPIGPPASLRAEAGDGRVRLVWTAPAGVDFQTAHYQYRYAAGASVPEETDWTGPTLDVFQNTVLLFGLTNGTPHAFEVRAVRGSEVGATATVSATPLTGVCSTPDLGDRREVWSATLTVGGVTGASQTDAGYRSGSYGSLGQNGDSFMIGNASYTIKDIFTIVGVEGDRRRITLTTVDNSRFTPAVGGALLFHWCSDSSGLTNPNLAGYQASNPNNADWSIHTTRELALSLAATTDTTAPTVTSITPQDPTSSPTNSDTLTWRVTFSEAVENVDQAAFMITGTTATLTVTPVTSLTGVYDVTASGGDLESLDGTVTLAFAADQNIVDPSDNTLTATTPTGANDPTFELDNTVPTFVSGTANGTLIVMTFSEELDPNSLPQASSFTITAVSSLPVPEPFANSVSIEGAMVTLTVAPAFITDHAVQVYNNAHQGEGRVPLKDFAGNAVQPAATVGVGSYSVTNETPIGPPASLRAEAGDGRVRLVWTRPAGTTQSVRYEYRHAAGASVPVETVWSGPTADVFQTTVLLFGLTNGTAHSFEVRAVHGSEVGATATVSAAPLAAMCNTPDLGGRRKVWSATLTVGRDIDLLSGETNAGYVQGSYGSLPQDGDSFMIGRASYTIEYIYTIVRSDGDRRQLFLKLADDRRFTPAVKEALRFHWCSDSSGFDARSGSDYRVSNDNQADWSLYDTREIALSLAANNDATGTPDITGRALAGQTLTAGMGDIADADGLPQNASDFAWQWIRAADETDTPIQDATSSTYTLTDDDAGKQVKVVMSFTDSLSGVESVTSDAYPSSSTVQRVLVSNIGQTETTENAAAGDLEVLDAAQEFTTGSNETGYTLSSIDLELTVSGVSNFPVVKLFSGSANGTEVAELTPPATAFAGTKATYTYAAPADITLTNETSYWVMAETGGGTWHTGGFAEDATPAPDWSIADRDESRSFSSTGPFSTDTDVALMIRVNGTVNNPFLDNFRAEAGNAQVTLRWDNPGDSSITKYQYRQRLTSESAWLGFTHNLEKV